jgi:hypothetical protein
VRHPRARALLCDDHTYTLLRVHLRVQL